MRGMMFAVVVLAAATVSAEDAEPKAGGKAQESGVNVHVGASEWTARSSTYRYYNYRYRTYRFNGPIARAWRRARGFRSF